MSEVSRTVHEIVVDARGPDIASFALQHTTEWLYATQVQPSAGIHVLALPNGPIAAVPLELRDNISAAIAESTDGFLTLVDADTPVPHGLAVQLDPCELTFSLRTAFQR